jgi:SpoVK/Ycf46/Vps4 family AAA+-type ATPase
MPKRRYDSDDSDIETPPVIVPKKKKTRPTIKFEELPSIKCLSDLIKVAETNKWYKNINNIMLWDILPYLKELNDMIGMKTVKESIFFQIIYYLQELHLRNKEGDYLHTIITGKPGSGKTTVSKILGGIYQRMGIFSVSSQTPKFKVASRDDFVGEYLGSTAIKTKKLLTSCIGGCLFVDELYSLGPGQKDRDSYSKEAIDVINLFLSEHKNDFCFIGAGYKEDIEKCFFSVNQGLKRRFQWYHEIDDYNDDDLVEIFLKMVKEINWINNVPKPELVSMFKEQKELLKDGGGSCENLLSKIKICHSMRVFGKESNYKFVIVKEDITDAFNLIKKYNTTKQPPEKTYSYYT